MEIVAQHFHIRSKMHFGNRNNSILASECSAIFTAFDMIFFVKSALITVFKLFKPSTTTFDSSTWLILQLFAENLVRTNEIQ